MAAIYKRRSADSGLGLRSALCITRGSTKAVALILREGRANGKLNAHFFRIAMHIMS